MHRKDFLVSMEVRGVRSGSTDASDGSNLSSGTFDTMVSNCVQLQEVTFSLPVKRHAFTNKIVLK